MPATLPTEVPLIEVFSSLQGEGVLIGCRQIFIRFAECNWTCDYCDTPVRAGQHWRLEEQPGCGRFKSRLNPAPLTELTEVVKDWHGRHPGLHHSLVLTGGEPLVHAAVLQNWLLQLRPRLPVFLETNGTLVDELVHLLPEIDLVSMDFKLAGSTGRATPWASHADFLRTAERKLAQVKVVLDRQTSRAELQQAAELMQRLAPTVPLVLQPRTENAVPVLGGADLLALQAVAAAVHPASRVIPQVHPWLGIA